MRSLVGVVLSLAAACGGSSSPEASAPAAPAAPVESVGSAAPVETSSALRVTGLEPVTGAADGDTLITIGVENVPASSSVKVFFGSVQAEIVRVGETEIIARVRGGKPDRTVDVLVIVEGKEITVPGAFTFTAGE